MRQRDLEELRKQLFQKVEGCCRLVGDLRIPGAFVTNKSTMLAIQGST